MQKTFSIDELMTGKGIQIQRFTVIALCMLVNMLDGFDITAMAVIVAELGEELQIQEDKLGLVFSFSLAGMMIGAMFLASLSDLFGRRTIILYSLLTVGISVFLTAYAHGLTELIILRFISGLGAGAMLASQAALAAEYSSDRYRALAVSVVTAGYPMGAMLTGIVAGFVVPEFGWRAIFILGGTVTLALGVVAFFLLPDSMQFLVTKQPKNALQKLNKILHKIGHAKLDSLPEASSAEQSAESSEAIQHGFISNIKLLLSSQFRFKTILLWLSFLFIVCTLYFLLSWLPKLLINEGFSTPFSRQAFTILNLGGVFGVFVLGWLAARYSLSVVVSVFLVNAFGLMLTYTVVPLEETFILVSLAAIGITLQGGFTGLYALAAKLYPASIRSTGVGWGIGVGRLGAVFGPAIAGYLIVSGFSLQANFGFFALPILLGAIGVYIMRIR